MPGRHLNTGAAEFPRLLPVVPQQAASTSHLTVAEPSGRLRSASGRVKRLFQIRTRFDAVLVTYAIALGATERGRLYLEAYPGVGGYLLAAACTATVFIAGGKLFDAVRADASSTPAR